MYLIVADSHGMKEEMFQLFEKYKGYKIIHCGDYCINESLLKDRNVNYVRGNCDFSGNDELLIDNDGCSIFVCHGDQYQVKYKYDNIYYKGLEMGAKFIIFGHTHKPLIMKIDDIYLLNPGSLKDKTYITIEDNIPKLERL